MKPISNKPESCAASKSEAVECRDLFGKSFSIRRDILNLPLEKWHIAATLDLSSITPRQWIKAMGGKGGFLTALLNAEEREFVRIVYLPNAEPTDPADNA